MSRPAGFEVMDVDTTIVNDPKFKRVRAAAPDLLPDAFMVYIAVLGESWRAAERTTVDDAWPVLLPPDAAVVEVLKAAKLLDRTGKIPLQAWHKRFTEANQRRIRARARYARYNGKRGERAAQPNVNHHAARDVDTAVLPRGGDVATATTEPFRSEPFRTVPNRSEPFRTVARAREADGTTETPELAAAIAYVEARTGRAWTFGEGSRPWGTLTADVRDFGWLAVQASMEAVAAEHPDIGQLVFGASRRLHPITSHDPPEGRAAVEQAAFDRDVERTRQRMAALRGEA